MIEKYQLNGNWAEKSWKDGPQREFPNPWIPQIRGPPKICLGKGDSERSRIKQELESWKKRVEISVVSHRGKECKARVPYSKRDLKHHGLSIETPEFLYLWVKTMSQDYGICPRAKEKKFLNPTLKSLYNFNVIGSWWLDNKD